jgi:hypothetical protein
LKPREKLSACNPASMPYLKNIDFKGLAEVINKLIFNNLHNPPPTKYFDIIINPLYSKQQLNLGMVEDCGVYIETKRKTQCM